MAEEYRVLSAEEINRGLFSAFIRRQEVNLCWRKIDGRWQIKPAPFVDDWSEEDYAFLVACLQNTVRTGGVVMGVFLDGLLKGFVSVESAPFGSEKQYLDLTSIHVSQDMRGAADWAREKGAGKLYISAHSAVESQAFYKAMGCVEAKEINAAHAEKEPFDCQLEFSL